MKYFEAKFEEQWEVVEDYFIKQLKKNMAQYRANERILRYKLEAYQMNFPDYICGNPTSTKVSRHNEDTKIGPSGIAQDEEIQTQESHDFISGAAQGEEVQPKIL